MNEATTGALVRQLRTQAGLTQEELAVRAGLSVRTVREAESGRRQPRGPSLRLIAGALGVAMQDLLTAAAGAPPGIGCRLPADDADFIGRAAAVTLLTGLLSPPGGVPVGVPVAVVAGRPGVGKTALGVHVAHALRDRFPDGQLYLRLGGEAPLDPAEALVQVLRALGMDGPDIPPALDERAAEFRARLADRRVLVVLDDAATEAQVRPLLPGTAGSAALVTSRAPLAGLLGARSVVLDVFDQEDSVRLLGRVSGPGRVAAEPEAAGRIARACAGLPLALRIAGARSAATPEVPLEVLADGLDDESRRLDELSAGDLAVRASFEVGYRQLDATARRAYRRLGLLRTREVPGWTVPALLDADPGAATAAMNRLVATRLVDGHGLGAARHYRMHDLIRLDARARAEAEETAADRTDAVRRALQGWLHLAAEADRRLDSDSDTMPLPDSPPAAWAPDAATVDTLLATPLDWFETERMALLDAVRQAGEVALDLAPVLLDNVLTFYSTRYHPDEWTAAAEVLLAEATAAGHRRVAGDVLRRLAEVHIFRPGEAAVAEARARTAVHDREAAGDLLGARAARLRLGSMRRFTLRPADALTELLAADTELLAAGLDGSAADVNVERGMVQITLLDLPAARTRFAAVAAVHERAGDLRGHATALAVLAQTYLREWRPGDALASFRQALVLLDRLGDRRLHATVTAHLGLAELATGGPADALITLGRALAAGEELADVEIVGLARLGIGEAHLRLGDRRSAAADFAAARERFAQAEAGYWGARAEEGLGLVAAAEGQADQARELLTRAEQLAGRFEPWRGDRIRATLAALPR